MPPNYFTFLDNGEIKGKGHQGIFIKDIWTKPKRGQDRGWEVGMVGGSGGGKWRQLYLNNNKKTLFVFFFPKKSEE